MKPQTKDQQIRSLSRNNLYWTIFLILLIFNFLGIIYLLSDTYSNELNKALNDIQINITQSYYNGLLTWTQTGKLVYLEQTFNGTQLKEISISEVCERLK